MAEYDSIPVVDDAAKKRLGQKLYKLFEQYKKDRREAEVQWLKNLRQFKGIYDPEIKIPADQSRAYPKITRTKVIATVARLMEMLFPQTEKNWAIQPSPLPDLSEADLQLVLDSLMTDTQEDPEAEITPEQIEKAIFEFAGKKAERMSKEMDDQLDEIHYVDLARKIVFSAVLYSVGILLGPMVKVQKGRTWTKDPYTNRFKAVTVDKMVPYYEWCSVWDWYPDLSAKEFPQMDGSFVRGVHPRVGIAKLADRPDFDKKAIKEYLRQNTSGNYKELHWEAELRSSGTSDRANVTDLSGRKYETWCYWGTVSGHELKACGAAVSDDQLSAEVEANVWGIGEVIIKAVINPYDEKIRPEHIFVYEEDEINLLGSALPNVMRDSQMAICEASRMLLDNASVVCGDMLEINTDVLMPGSGLDVYARRVWLRDGTGPEANIPAVKAIKMDSHLPELQSIVQMFLGFADTETALPPSAMGDPSQGGSEALRTTGGMSMLMGAAALPIRDTVRNYDRFTTSFISSLYYWNMQFNPNEKIKGDYAVIARGSTSLIAKEVRAYSLDNFSATLTPDERMELKGRKLLEERMKVRDLPLDLLEDEAVVKQNREAQVAEMNQDKAAQTEMLAAEIKKTLAEAFKDVSLATKAQVGASVDTFNATVEGIARAKEADQAGGEGTEGGGVPSSARAGAAGAAKAG